MVLKTLVVNEQRREIAIRLAMGAQRGNILKMVLHRGLGLTAAGAGLGIAAALIVSHLMAGLLYGVSPAICLPLGASHLYLRRFHLRPAICPRVAPCGSTYRCSPRRLNLPA